MTESNQSPELEAFSVLIGEWTTEATHPAYEGVVVPGRSQFEWLEGQRFLILRARAEHPDFPDSISIIGATDDLQMHYFDSRGVHRIYEMSLRDGVLRIWRDAPGFSQRFTGTIADDGKGMAGVWELSTDDSTWAADLEIDYKRVA
jgi:hypothetical protein